MAVKDYTGQMIETLRMFRPDIRPIDFSNVLDNFNNAYDKAYNKSLNNAYSDALASSDEERASKIAAMLDPAGERAMKQALKQREEDRQWALEDDARKYQQALDLERVRTNNAIGLAKLKASLAASAGGQDTTAMRNINYLISQGYSPQEAAALYYGGQNSTLNLATLGQKGQEALDKKTAENYAEDLDSYNNLVSNLPALEQMVGELSDLGKNATYTKGGSLLNEFRKETGMKTRQSAIDSAAYKAKVNQNLLPLLRQTFGSAFTENDRKQLQETLGDPLASPEEKEVVLSEFIQNKRREIESKKRKLDSYKPSVNSAVIDASKYFE